MKRHLACLVIVASASMLVGCDEGSTLPPPTGSGGDAGVGGMGGTGGDGGMAGGGGQGGAGNVCGDGVVAGGEACDDANVNAGDGCDDVCAIESGYACSGAPSACVTVCGDGILAGAEACDDANGNAGDGCDGACGIEVGFSCSGAPSACATTCGDGIVAGAEACDDANGNAGDGCDGACGIEVGFSCSGAPSACVTTCGDGIVAGAEACDDANGNAGDGCDGACVVEVGFSCSGAPSACVTTCGDGIVAGAEACDDANGNAGDGCDTACVVEVGFSCSGTPSACVTTCGDGIVAGAEACDDANMDVGDGCTLSCTVESGFSCIGQPSACITTCGDGIPAGAEICDDGNIDNGDGCTNGCVIESGYSCTGQPSACVTTCGDGVIAGIEACDDGNSGNNDGCNMSCGLEFGFSCTGQPSLCVTTCGDGIVAGSETCDDGAVLGGDGCSDLCAIETGYTCSGAPSVCSTTCGDGVAAGSELCDDGNTVSGDGCNANCTPSTGENCSDTMAMVQATVVNGTYTWLLSSGAVTATDGDFTCDPNTKGPDAVIAYVKSSPNLAGGGKLLHVVADTPTSTTTSNYLNLEITDKCLPGVAKSLQCNWYKDNWDAYIDVPAGTYYIWVQKNSTGTFPVVSVVAEEVDAIDAEGEGCFEPYTAASSNYTPPVGAGDPHTWILPATINSFDMGSTWGEPQSITCDNTATYGDITGVDAVIEFDKQSPSSVLQINVQNNDPTQTQSDLNVEVLNVCSPVDAGKISRHCRANLDTISVTAPSPAGPVYLWVTTEATSEEFNGATVQVKEIFPGIGESWPTAEPLMGSGSIVATSMQRLDAPTCFPAAGNIHWFSYTLTNDALSFGTNVAGYVGVYDGGGQQVACVTDASVAPLGLFGAPGKTFYIAVQSPTAIGSFSIGDFPYSGVGDVVTDMQITFPASATTDYGMVVNGTDIVLGGTSSVFAFANVVGAAAVQYGTAEGITTTHLGYDLVALGGLIFSVDSTTTTSANRLFRIFDGTAWGPGTAWDLTPNYVASSPTYAIATDGTNVFMASRRTTSNGSTDFYQVSPSAPNTPVLLGTTPSLWYGVGLAADNQYFYLTANGSGGEGVYRVNRTNLSAGATKIATIDTSTTANNIEVDAFVNPQYLYVRAYGGDTHVIVQPGSANPAHLGVINTLGTTSDYAMAYDKVAKALYVFETESDAAGRILRIE